LDQRWSNTTQPTVILLLSVHCWPNATQATVIFTLLSQRWPNTANVISLISYNLCEKKTEKINNFDIFVTLITSFISTKLFFKLHTATGADPGFVVRGRE